MPFRELDVKGMKRYLIDADLDGEPLHAHVSVVPPGGRAHPPHRHGGYEAFYLLAGQATLEFADERVELSAGETAVFDPHKLHGLVNTGDVDIRYLVILVDAGVTNP